MQIFGGSSNQELVEKIVMAGGGEAGKIKIGIFENGEAKVSVAKGNGVAVLIQSFSNPVDSHIIEFCLIVDALSRAGYSDVVGVVPWLGYSKQDKIFAHGEPLSAKVIAKIIQTTKIKKLITFDLHNRAITGFFDIPVVELSAKGMFVDYFREKFDKNEMIIVAPDEGAVKASGAIARELGVGIAYIDKRRDPETGEVKIVGMSGKVEGKNVVIVDDMIVTGSTMMEVAEYLKNKGARGVSVAATHHLGLSGVQEKLEHSMIDEIVITDTVRSELGFMIKDLGSEKLKILSVGELIVDELKNF